jgi:hypothetical protein
LTLDSAGASLSFEEAAMPNKVRINLVNPAELLELPGIGPEQAGAILRFRAEHGPIKDPDVLVKILGTWPIAEAIWERVDFAPADSTAAEAPGA